METFKKIEDGLVVIYLGSIINTILWTLFLLHPL